MPAREQRERHRTLGSHAEAAVGFELHLAVAAEAHRVRGDGPHHG